MSNGVSGLRVKLPEVAVGVDDPHSKALDPLLFCSDPLVASEHAKGELVDARLQHGAELLLEVGGLVLEEVVVAPLAHTGGVQGAVGVGHVVVVVRLDQGEQGPGHLTPLLCFWGGGPRRGGPLGAAPPSGEVEAAPAAVPGGLRLVYWAFPHDLLVIYAPGGAGHFKTLQTEQNRADLPVLMTQGKVQIAVKFGKNSISYFLSHLIIIIKNLLPSNKNI